MPVNPPAWVAGQQVTAKKLNTDLYSYIPGNAYTPNGILFHTQKPTVMEYTDNNTGNTQPFSSAGSSFAPLLAPQAGWVKVWDSSSYYGPGMDASGQSQGRITSTVLGAEGAADTSVQAGGFYWIGGNITTNPSSSLVTVGAGVSFQGGTTPSPLCTNQTANPSSSNIPFALDIIRADATSHNWAIGGNAAGTVTGSVGYFPGSTPQYDWSGAVCRLYAFWASVDDADYSGNGQVVTGGPTPPSSYTGASVITAATLNSQVNNTLTFLNMPPLLRVSTALSQSIPTGLSTGANTILLTQTGTGHQDPQVDNYEGWNDTTHTYTVPVDGVYLVHGAVSMVSDSANAYQRLAGVNINGTIILFGPSYRSAASSNTGTYTISTVTRLLDLHAGDTVKLIAEHNAAGSVSTNNSSQTPCRLLMQWMGALSTGTETWTNPDPGFRWQAGTPSSQLPALFQQHLANDLSFLIHKPYLLTQQTVVQTGFAANTDHTVTMDSVSGKVHASNGDNYAGWTTGASNKYTAQRAGWYMVVGEYMTSGTPPYLITAKVNAPGASAQVDSNYWCQAIQGGSFNVNANAGATYANLQYLRVGDTITPTVRANPGSGTWNTATGFGQQSSFGLIWLSQ